MASIVEVMQRNDIAVNLLLQGNTDIANSILLECLDNVQRILRRTNVPSLAPASSGRTIELPPSAQQEVNANAGRSSLIPTREDFVYGRPLKFHEVLASYDLCSTCRSTGSAVSAIVVFNLAIMHHHMLCLHPDQESLLSRAEHLYAMVVRLTNTRQPDEDGQTCTLPFELSVLALNNLSQLSRDQGKSADAQSMAMSLQLTLSRVGPCQRSQLHLIREHWHCLLANTALMASHTVSRPASAA